MIYDWEVPHIGGVRAGQFQQLWRKIQRDLRDGSPLLVDSKGNALTEARTGGFNAIAEGWDIIEELPPAYIFDAEGRRVDLDPTDWSAQELNVPADHQAEELNVPADHQADALRFAIDYPYQLVTVKRAKGWRLWLLRIRNAPYNLYFDLRSWLQPGWADRD